MLTHWLSKDKRRASLSAIEGERQQMMSKKRFRFCCFVISVKKETFSGSAQGATANINSNKSPIRRG